MNLHSQYSQSPEFQPKASAASAYATVIGVGIALAVVAILLACFIQRTQVKYVI